jgi:TonB family protein
MPIPAAQPLPRISELAPAAAPPPVIAPVEAPPSMPPPRPSSAYTTATLVLPPRPDYQPATQTGTFADASTHSAGDHVPAKVHMGSFDAGSGTGSGKSGAGRGLRAQSGFETVAPQRVQGHSRQVRASGFADVAKAGPAPPPPVAAPARVESRLEILSKPRPAYSEAARRLGFQGDVVLEAVFQASGRVQVLRVVRGLGYGLDENAVLAAGGIRFRPATVNGVAVDTVATVRITFQLAN